MSKINIELTKESKKLIEKLAKAGDLDLRPIMKVIGTGYRKEVNLIFDKQQPRAEGLRWPPLSPAYAKQKEKEWPGRPLLVRSGSLLASMIVEGATGNITIIGKTFATFGSSIPYAVFHDSDEPRSSNLPRRNFSEPSDRRAQIWMDQIEKDIRTQFERAGIEVKGDLFKE